MKIAVIITGGTILSAEHGGYLAPDAKRKAELTELLNRNTEIEIINPYTILSEQLDGDYLTTLINQVGKILDGGFDGVIVLHGTDTLQYSAAALSLAYGSSDIPIVLVSSNFILNDPRSNGRDNLKYAVKFIEEKIGGVFVSYKNTNSKPEIHLGSRLLPHLPYSGDLTSLHGSFGYFEDGIFTKTSEKDNTETLGAFSLQKDSPVLYLKAYAGFNPPDIGKHKAVLIEAFHSGTLPTENEELISFCKNAGVPIYVVGVPDEIRYQSTAVYGELGLEVMPPISPIYAYIGLWQKYSDINC